MSVSTLEKLNAIKETFEKQKLIRKVVKLSSIKIISTNLLEYKNHEFFMSDLALADLFKIMDLNKKLIGSINTSMSPDSKMKLIGILQRAISQANDKNIVIAADVNGNIQRIFSSKNNKGGASLSMDSFFEMTHEVLNIHPAFGIDHWGVNQSGVHITLKDNEKTMNVGNFKDEAFRFGLSLSNNYSHGTTIEHYTKRLVCSNGMVTNDESIRYNLQPNFSDRQWMKFYEHIDTLKKNDFASPYFSQKVTEAINTPASIAEMETGCKLLRSHSDIGKDIDLFFPESLQCEKDYRRMGVEISTLDKKQLSTHQSPCTVWDVINKVTDFASHSYNYEISSMQRTNLMISSGKLLSKKYDMKSLANVNPYSLN
jgi:hypothetical protein